MAAFFPTAYIVEGPIKWGQERKIYMGITNSNKVLSTDHIPCGGEFKITLSLTAEPSIVSNPVDVVLILDRSRSMLGAPLDNLKKGALKFIDILDESTDGSHDGQIGGAAE